MARSRRTFDEEFKRNAVRMLADGRSIRSVANRRTMNYGRDYRTTHRGIVTP